MGLLRIPRFARTSNKTNDHARVIPDICLPFNSSQPNDRIGVCDREGGILLMICPIGGKKPLFWLIVICLIVVFGVPLAATIVRREQISIKPAIHDIGIYKDQIVEVDRDLERGLINKEEAKSAHNEVARRLLAADKRAAIEQGATAASHKMNWIALVIVCLALIGSVWLYTEIGVPGMRDLPLANRLAAQKAIRDARPDQLTAEANAPALDSKADPGFENLIVQLRKAVARNPKDTTGLRLLVTNEARLGNMIAARMAQEQLMAVLGDTAKHSDFTDTGEIMILAAGGYVSPQAEAELIRALSQNPTDPRARYYSGLLLAQTGRPEMTYRMWSTLLEEGPEDAPWIPLIQSQIVQVARAAGIRLSPKTLINPSIEYLRNTTELSTENDAGMIRGMVASLSNRLATEGGTPTEWAKLIRSYGVLGERSSANTVWHDAKEIFKDNPEAMALLTEAARTAEIIN